MKRPSETIHFVVPGSLDQATGGYRYDAAIIAGLRASGHTVIVHELAGNFPVVDGQAVAAARAVRVKIGTGIAVIDGLALPAFAACLGSGARIAGLVHHPLWLESPAACDLRGIEAALAAETEQDRRDQQDNPAGCDGAPRSRPVPSPWSEPGTARGALRVRSSAGRARLLCVGHADAAQGTRYPLSRSRVPAPRAVAVCCVSVAPPATTSHARRLRALVAQLAPWQARAFYG